MQVLAEPFLVVQSAETEQTAGVSEETEAALPEPCVVEDGIAALAVAVAMDVRWVYVEGWVHQGLVVA